MHKRNTTSAGFTIVELLIVIVVIAILAAISVASYAGVRHRANDAAVQSDLRQFRQKMEIFFLDNGSYPNHYTLESLQLRITKGAYETDTPYNLLYCHPTVATEQYALLALTKSGAIFWVSSNLGSVGKYTGAWHTNQADTCVDAGSPVGTGSNNARGYASDEIGWRPWTGAN